MSSTLLVQKGTVAERPEDGPQVGREEELLPRRDRRVGRIELADHTKVGTGFIAGERCILTNNHVVCALFGRDRRPSREVRFEAVNSNAE